MQGNPECRRQSGKSDSLTNIKIDRNVLVSSPHLQLCLISGLSSSYPLVSEYLCPLNTHAEWEKDSRKREEVSIGERDTMKPCNDDGEILQDNEASVYCVHI